MHHSLRVFSLWLALIVSFAATMLQTSTSFAEELKGAGLGLDMLERLTWTKLGADGIPKHLDIVEWEDEYCVPPDVPNKEQEEQFLKGMEKTLQVYVDRYNELRPKFLTLFANDGKARNAVLAKLPKEANPMDNSFWQPWQDSFRKARQAIKAKRDELAKKPVKPCRVAPEPPPPPPPPSTDPGIPLPQVEERPAEIPPPPGRFCSEAEKQAAITALRDVAYDFYLNYQDAREFYDAIKDALDAGRGNRLVLASMLPAAKENLARHTKRLDEFHKELERVIAMPVVDCGGAQPQPPPPDDEQFQQPSYEPAAPLQVPNRFCSEAEKQAFLDKVQANSAAARRNYEKANAFAEDLQKRINAGDRSRALGNAHLEASRAATTNFNLWIALDPVYQKAKAMPVVDCGPQTDTGHRIGQAPATGGSAADLDYAIRFGGEFGNWRMGSGGFYGFEVSPTDRGVGSVRPNLDVDARGVSADLNIYLPEHLRTGWVPDGRESVRVHISTLTGDGHASGLFETQGATLLPGLGGPGEAGFLLPEFVGFSNDIDWRYFTEQDVFDFGVAWETDLSAGRGYRSSGFVLSGGAGVYTAERNERITFDIPDFAASGAYTIKSDITAPYLNLGGAYTHSFRGGDWAPYVRADADVRAYFYDASAGVRFTPNFAPEHVRDLSDSGTEFGWSGGVEVGVDIDSAAMQLYVGYRHMENELSPIVSIPGGDDPARLGVGTNDVDLVVVGARVRF